MGTLGRCRTKVVEETDATFGALFAGASPCIHARCVRESARRHAQERARAGMCVPVASLNPALHSPLQACAQQGGACMLAHTGSGGGRKCMTGPADGPDAATCPPRTAPTPPPVLRQATTAHSTPKKPDAGSALSSASARTSSGRQLARLRPAKSEASGLTIWLPSADSRPRLPPALPRFMRPSTSSCSQMRTWLSFDNSRNSRDQLRRPAEYRICTRHKKK